MSGTQRSSDGLDARRKKILFRSWHRGMREMDLLLGQFADACLDGLSNEELDTLESLMEIPDRDVLAWITGEKATPATYDSALFQKIVSFHTHKNAIL